MAPRQLALLAAVTLGCDPPDAGSDPPADACGSFADAPLEPDGGGGQPLVSEGPCPAAWPLVASRIHGSGATWRLGLDDRDAPWLVDGDWLVRVRATARDCTSGICTAIDECLPVVVTSTADATTPGIFALSPNYAIAIDDPDDELVADEIALVVDILVPEEVAGECVADVRLNGSGPQAVLMRSSPWQPVPSWPTTWAMASRGCEGLSFCGASCADLAVDPANCGACGSVCEGACIAGACHPALLTITGGVDLLSDGAGVAWIEPDDFGVPRVIRRAEIVDGALDLDELTADAPVHAWSASGGPIAWIENHGTSFRLRRWDSADALEILGLPHEGPSVQPLATSSAWAGVVESQLHLYGYGDAGELELVDCFATIAGAYDFAALGDDLFVLSDDTDADTAVDLWRCTADGTQAEERLDDTEIGDTAWAFVEAAGSVLYLGLPDQLRRVDVGLRTSTRVASTTSPLFATDARHAYVRTQDGITRIGDGDPVVIVPPHPHGDFAVAGEHLFVEDGWGHLVAFELPAASE